MTLGKAIVSLETNDTDVGRLYTNKVSIHLSYLSRPVVISNCLYSSCHIFSIREHFGGYLEVLNAPWPRFDNSPPSCDVCQSLCISSHCIFCSHADLKRTENSLYDWKVILVALASWVPLKTPWTLKRWIPTSTKTRVSFLTSSFVPRGYLVEALGESLDYDLLSGQVW